MIMEETIEEFIADRIAETRRKWQGFGEMSATMNGLCAQLWKVVEMHKDWPVLLKTPSEIKPDYNDQFVDHIDNIKFTMTQQIAFLTQEEYRKKFGNEPPTAPMVLSIARMWSDHPDFKEEWREE